MVGRRVDSRRAVVRRGEIWWVESPTAGRRPHLVLTRDAAIGPLDRVLGVPATRRIRGIPTEVKLDVEDGMPQPCVLSLDNTRVLPKAYFVDRICALGPERMDAVCRALSYATGCR
jgi:mRNA interferase MazF